MTTNKRKIKYIFTTPEKYHALEEKNPGYLYFLTSGELYRGDILYGSQISIINNSSIPMEGIANRIYYNEDDRSLSIWKNNKWKLISPVISDNVDLSKPGGVNANDNLVTVDALKKYINTLVDRGIILTPTNVDSKYQVKGDYVDQSKYDNKMKTVDSDITDLKSFKDSASKVYQPKGDYLTPTNADSKYQVKGDYVTNSVLTTKLGEYQPKGEYATKSEIESSIKLKAEKVHNHEVTDINGLDEKLSEIKLEDTAIDVIAEEKKLNVVLSELRNKDVEQSTEILNLKNELNGYVARHKVANDSIQKSIND